MSRRSAAAGIFALFVGMASAGGAGPARREEDTHGRTATPDYARVFARALGNAR